MKQLIMFVLVSHFALQVSGQELFNENAHYSISLKNVTRAEAKQHCATLSTMNSVWRLLDIVDGSEVHTVRTQLRPWFIQNSENFEQQVVGDYTFYLTGYGEGNFRKLFNENSTVLEPPCDTAFSFQSPLVCLSNLDIIGRYGVRGTICQRDLNAMDFGRPFENSTCAFPATQSLASDKTFYHTCVSHCRATPGCAAANFCEDEKKCFLYNDCNTVTKLPSDSELQHCTLTRREIFRAQKMADFDAKPNQRCLYTGAVNDTNTIFSYTINQHNLTDLHECVHSCRLNVNCGFASRQCVKGNCRCYHRTFCQLRSVEFLLKNNYIVYAKREFVAPACGGVRAYCHSDEDCCKPHGQCIIAQNLCSYIPS